MKITASHLYNFDTCPHRVWRDAHDDPAFKDKVNEFVQMLWDKGYQYEKEVIDQLEKEQAAKPAELPKLLDLSSIPKHERAAKTEEAIANKAPLIYQGRLETDELRGEPDLLELQPNGEYMPIDIKSGQGLQGATNEKPGKLKPHYALQLALYVDALQKLGHTKSYQAKILDSTGRLVDYPLDQPRGKRGLAKHQTWWELYEETLIIVRNIHNNKIQTEPALISECGMCQWYSTCKQRCIDEDLLSLIPGLGRTGQENLSALAPTVKDLASIKPEEHIHKGKVDIDGVGPTSLHKFNERAKILSSGTKEPVLKKPFSFPHNPVELFFDIETDPTQDILYLHGVIERRNDKQPAESDQSPFHPFTANECTPEAEAKAFQQFWDYIKSIKEPFTLYVYSQYERTQFKRLQKKYPEIVEEDEVEKLLGKDEPNCVDLMTIATQNLIWPTYNHSIKTLATHLGFEWRDAHPSGAASIKWYNEWLKSRDPNQLQRILDYNEDDCRAMIVLKDYLEKFSNKG